MDQFPATSHVENCCQIIPKKIHLRLRVTMEPDEESNYTPEEKATYQKIKDYVKDKYGVNVHTSLYCTGEADVWSGHGREL